LRGIPRTTPALPLFSQLRRFTLATLTAAETAADFAAIMTNGETDPDDIEQAEEWDRIEIERGAMITTPFGSSITQLKAEHPNATYDEFVRAILREIARCLSVPAVIALGDASSYNYASGRLDLQSFTRQMGVDRSQVLENEFLDRLWEAWLDEALLIDGFLPELFRRTAGEWEFGWRWTRARARRPREGSNRPANRAGQQYNHAGKRIRPPRVGLGDRAAAASPRSRSCA
jgi:capsid protein